MRDDAFWAAELRGLEFVDVPELQVAGVVDWTGRWTGRRAGRALELLRAMCRVGVDVGAREDVLVPLGYVCKPGIMRPVFEQLDVCVSSRVVLLVRLPYLQSPIAVAGYPVGGKRSPCGEGEALADGSCADASCEGWHVTYVLCSPLTATEACRSVSYATFYLHTR